VKKILTVALAAVMAASMLAPASAGKAKPQVQEGTILLPAVFATGLGADGCWGGATRRTTQTAGMAVNGIVGYRFPVDKATWGGKFVLEPTAGQGTVDLDLFLYSFMPGPEEAADDPVNGGSPVSQDFAAREAGGETGIVPAGTTDAIVCLYGGVAGYAGFDASFKYTATPPAKKKK
jgi:hypothetical protein